AERAVLAGAVQHDLDRLVRPDDRHGHVHRHAPGPHRRQHVAAFDPRGRVDFQFVSPPGLGHEAAKGADALVHGRLVRHFHRGDLGPDDVAPFVHNLAADLGRLAERRPRLEVNRVRHAGDEVAPDGVELDLQLLEDDRDRLQDRLDAAAVVEGHRQAGVAALDPLGQLEADGDGAALVGPQSEGAGRLAVGAVALPVHVHLDLHGDAGEHAALDLRRLARGDDLLTRAVRFAGELQLLVESRALVVVDQELALLLREAAAGLADDQRVFAAGGVRRQRVGAAADALDGLAVRAEHRVPVRGPQPGRALPDGLLLAAGLLDDVLELQLLAGRLEAEAVQRQRA